MYELGAYIVHPGQGVCKVDEIVSEPQACYMLLPVGVRNPVRISYPVASEDRLRPIIGAPEAEELIDAYPEMEVDPRRERSIALEEDHFRKAIRQASCAENLRIAKTFHQRMEDVHAQGRKHPVAYERVFKQATDRALMELAVALGIDVEGVRGRFAEQGVEDFS
jgi:CarD family transcriptional regulator